MPGGGRVGQGYDVHAFTAGDGIVLGGVRIDCDKSIVAHSDGDVVIHALCDALCGALGRGDIGRHFPDDDARHENRDSREFLRAIMALAETDGYRIGNADVTVVAQAPRLAAHIDAMRRVLAQDLDCGAERVNVKATTTERLGFIGREEGIAALAVVMLEPRA